MLAKLRIAGIVLSVGLVVGGVWIDYGPTVNLDGLPSWSWFSSKPVMAVVVRESENPLALSQAQVAWVMSAKLRADAKAAGVQFYLVDPNQKDVDGKTPAELKQAIDRAVAKGLPRLILVGPRGGIVDYVLPADEAAARKRLGIGG